jgi:hypothetical protein
VEHEVGNAVDLAAVDSQQVLDDLGPMCTEILDQPFVQRSTPGLCIRPFTVRTRRAAQTGDPSTKIRNPRGLVAFAVLG